MSSPPNSDANTPSLDQNVKRRRRRRGQQDQYPIRQYTPTTPMLPREGVSTGPSPIGLRLTRIYVGNLPQHMRKEDALIGFFSRYGDIAKVNIATGRGVNNNNRPQQQQQAPPSSTSPRNQQRVLNYGFIQYLNGSSADAAVLDVKGRREAGLERLRVGYAKTKPGVDDIQGDVDAEPLPPLPEGATDPCRVFVAGFQNTETVEMLGDFLSQWGLINLLQLVMDRETGHSKGFGFVQFSCPEGAQRLLSEMMNKGAYEKQEEEEQQQETKAATPTSSSGVVKKPVYYQQLIVRGRMIDCKYRVSKEGVHGPSSASQSSGGAPPPAAQFGLNDEEKSMYTERAIARHVAKVEESRRRRGITAAAGPAGAQQPMLTPQGDAPCSQEVAQYNNSNDNTTPPPPPPPPPPPTGYVNEVPSNNTAVTNPNDNIQPYQQSLPSQYQPPYRGSRQLDSTGQWGGGPHPPPTSGGDGGVAYPMPLSSSTTREGSGYMNDAGLTSYTGMIQKPAQASGYGGSSAPPWDTTQQQQQPTGGGGYGSYYQPPTPQPQRRDAAASGVSLPRMMGSSSSSSEYRDDREHRWQRQEQVSPSSSSLSSPSPTQYTPLYPHHHQQQPSSHGRAIITPRRSPRRASSSSAPSREAYRYTADDSPARRRDQKEYPQPQQLYAHSPKRPRTSRTSSPPVAGSWYSVEVARNNTIIYSDEDDDEYTIR